MSDERLVERLHAAFTDYNLRGCTGTHLMGYGDCQQIAARLLQAPVQLDAPDQPTTCPKCSGGEYRTQYHEGSVAMRWRQRVCAMSDVTTQSGEHLHRYCQTCQYDWADPIDPRPSREPRE